jgi:hypothetical protein
VTDLNVFYFPAAATKNKSKATIRARVWQENDTSKREPEAIRSAEQQFP